MRRAATMSSDATETLIDYSAKQLALTVDRYTELSQEEVKRARVQVRPALLAGVNVWVSVIKSDNLTEPGGGSAGGEIAVYPTFKVGIMPCPPQSRDPRAWRAAAYCVFHGRTLISCGTDHAMVEHTETMSRLVAMAIAYFSRMIQYMRAAQLCTSEWIAGDEDAIVQNASGIVSAALEALLPSAERRTMFRIKYGSILKETVEVIKASLDARAKEPCGSGAEAIRVAYFLVGNQRRRRTYHSRANSSRGYPHGKAPSVTKKDEVPREDMRADAYTEPEAEEADAGRTWVSDVILKCFCVPTATNTLKKQ